ncbi:MAG: ribonuclease II [Spirochaetes bacterium RBG_13_68_11]|nr:MAG: ribonuclease II [Spirochaetes bacterium RBG_13_68_11]
MPQTQHTDRQHRAILADIAQRAMRERGLLPDFPAAVLAELERIRAPAGANGGSAADPSDIRDLMDLPWTSIDNDDSRDLDQLTVAEALPGANVKILVAVADVDALVKSGSAIDEYARHNTTSVYTAAKNFPMLPEKLSTDLTSLSLDEERLAVVVEMVIGVDGSLQGSDIYRARVRNHAKLAYNSVAAWLEGDGAAPAGIAAVNGLAENLRVQDRIAQGLKGLRHVHGALSLETIEAKPVFDGDHLRDLEVEQKNRAKEIIEDFMIAANGATARYLEARAFPSIRRVVRTPKRWDRIVELAREREYRLPENPDSAALDEFLVKQKAADPLRFPDLSLAVIKLLGRGEYAAEQPGDAAPGHFGLAVEDYAHSTAPNRRYADLIAQRLLKAAIAGRAAPYRYAELEVLATHLTEEEDAANKVERQVGKSAAALLLESRVGEQFDAIVTGASDKGTWARLLTIPVDGMVVRGFEGVDVGDRIRVQLTSVDVERGFIDFRNVGSSGH